MYWTAWKYQKCSAICVYFQRNRMVALEKSFLYNWKLSMNRILNLGYNIKILGLEAVCGICVRPGTWSISRTATSPRKSRQVAIILPRRGLHLAIWLAGRKACMVMSCASNRPRIEKLRQFFTGALLLDAMLELYIFVGIFTANKMNTGRRIRGL